MQYTKDNFSNRNGMDMENYDLLLVLLKIKFKRVIGKMIYKMAMEQLHGLMETIIMVNL